MAFACVAREDRASRVSSTVRACAGALVAVLEIRGGVLCCEFVEEVEVGVWCVEVMTKEVEEAFDELLSFMQHR